MKATVIIPCHPKNLPTLQRTLDSVAVAAEDLDVETLVIHDDEARGLSWARNQGLDRATGDVAFFVDADDTVRPRFFSALLDLLGTSDADFALSNYDYAPLKRAYNLSGNAAIRSAMLPAFFGYGLDDIRRWNADGALVEKREQGGVWRGAFRLDFLRRWEIRFDENLRLYEDSPFVAECAARARRVASTGEVLYDYVPGEDGILANAARSSDTYWAYKFDALANRKAMAGRIDGGGFEGTLSQFAGSAALSALEFLRARRFRDFRRYASDGFVRWSLANFPISIRHPLVAAAIVVARRMAHVCKSGSER